MRSRLTYANVLSTIALFIALGGGAYAATQLPANSVGTTQLKNSAVTSRKVKDHTIVRKDVASGQFATPQQLAGKLGAGATAVNSNALGGIGAGGFLKGAGHHVTLNYDKTADDDTLLAVPGGGAIALKCSSSGFNILFRAVTNNFDAYQSITSNGNPPNIRQRSATPSDSFVFVPGKVTTEAHFDVQSDSGGAALTMWARFDDSIDHCIGRIRGLAFP
jgi:hypothetical protein